MPRDRQISFACLQTSREGCLHTPFADCTLWRFFVCLFAIPTPGIKAMYCSPADFFWLWPALSFHKMSQTVLCLVGLVHLLFLFLQLVLPLSVVCRMHGEGKDFGLVPCGKILLQVQTNWNWKYYWASNGLKISQIRSTLNCSIINSTPIRVIFLHKLLGA
jgi:cytochrome b561